MKPVLDACCGGRMFWFDKKDERAVFADIREEEHDLSNGQKLVVAPDVISDFRKMIFEDETFHLVVFDPPHLMSLGKTSWLAKKYGELFPSWKNDLAEGFKECFRVLKPNGTLIFKWNEYQVPLKDVLELTPEQPLFGNRDTKKKNTHWVVFMKT